MKNETVPNATLTALDRKERDMLAPTQLAKNALILLSEERRNYEKTAPGIPAMLVRSAG